MTGFVKKTLPELIASLPGEIFGKISTSVALPTVEVTGLTEDSRNVMPGYIFVAIRGGTQDGHRFIPGALANGAVAVVGPDPAGNFGELPVPYVQVSDARKASAYLSAAFYGYPAHHMTMIGVTGTDGKTTTSNLIYQILLAAGLPVGMISTVNAVIGDEVIDTGFHVTTPTAPEIQRYLARMRAAGLTHVILETTSHSLAQQRVTGCAFDIGVLTNITHEHLDQHGTFEAYRDAKASLFTGLGQEQVKESGAAPLAVLNQDDSSYEFIRAEVKARSIGYSLKPQAGKPDPELYAESIQHDAQGLHFVAKGPNFSISIDSPLIGLFNVSNCLAAIGASVIGLGIAPETARSGIAAMRGIPGRMEQITMGQPFMAIVDFAHTPNALRRALEAMREMVPGRVIAVFGSAGLRDREKRRIMAEVSAELADISVLTAEDPRTESLDGILEEMAAGARAKGGVEGQTFLRVRDRGEAIRQALRIAQKDDLVVACGKGHEQSMCFGTHEYPWDDRVAMRAALAEQFQATGPQMPYLPTQDEK